MAYVHGEQFWFNLGYYYDKVHQQLGGQVEPYRRFTEIIFKKLSEADVQQKLGDCMYLKPSASSALLSKYNMTCCKSGLKIEQKTSRLKYLVVLPFVQAGSEHAPRKRSYISRSSVHFIPLE